MATNVAPDIDKLADALIAKFVPPAVVLVIDEDNYEFFCPSMYAKLRSVDGSLEFGLDNKIQRKVFPRLMIVDGFDMAQLMMDDGIIARTELCKHYDALLKSRHVDIVLPKDFLFPRLNEVSSRLHADNLKEVTARLRVCAGTYTSTTDLIKLSQLFANDALSIAWQAATPSSAVKFRQYT